MYALTIFGFGIGIEINKNGSKQIEIFLQLRHYTVDLN
jgi:hypothetical protein